MGRRITAGVLWAILLIVVMSALPARGHTRAELGEWVVEWSTRADYALSAGLVEELRGMQDRHAWYFNPQPATRQTILSQSPGGWSGSVEEWRPLVVRFFAPEKVETAMCIMGHESRGDPSAKNPRSSAAGLFQFLRGTWDSVPLSVSGGSYDSGQAYDPVANVRSAAWLQNAAGWSQWSPWARGECRNL